MIGLRVPGAIGYRHLAIRVVSTACKMALDADPAAPGTDFESEVVSAFGEAFNNVAVHSYRGLAPGPVQIEVGWDDDQLFITVVDHGHSFDPDTISDPNLDELPEGGMGLFIMRSCMDEVDYRPGPPNVLRMIKRRGRADILPPVPPDSTERGEGGPELGFEGDAGDLVAIARLAVAPKAQREDHPGEGSRPIEGPGEENRPDEGDRSSGVDLVPEQNRKSGRSTPRMRAVVPESDDGVVETLRRR